MSPPALRAQSTAPPEERIAERRVPDYDGREERTSAGEALLWIPRILVSPLYLLTEYVVRRPLGYVVTRVEEAELQGRIVQFFHFGEGDRYYLAPTFNFDLGFRPNIGVNFGVKDAFADGNTITASYSFGGTEWHVASLADHYTWDDGKWEFGIQGRVTDRADGRFWGLGSEVHENVNSGFDWLGFDSELFIERSVSDQGHLRLSTGARYRTFGEDSTRNVSVPDRFAQGLISELPPGYEAGYTIHFVGVDVAYDSRDVRPNPASGVRISAHGELAYSVRDPNEQLWVRYGGGVGGYLDVSGNNHILSLTGGVWMVEAVHGDVPFTEQPVISGVGPMGGFLGSFLTGESAVTATLSYSWPIWVYLDGVAHASVGNVFDGRFSDFGMNKLRLSAGVGIAAVSQRDHFFEFLVGFGTNTFQDGADIDSVRVTFGGRREF